MCGIAGIYFHSRPERRIDPMLLRRMNDLMTHRGPDAEGYYQNDRIALAMRRLKVIDLELGDQPVHNGDESVWIIFNGEVYNYRELRSVLEKKGHRFRTQSDTEVILRQYLEEGEQCVHAFNGMFAFAIYDAKKDTLFLARDRLGIKPFFYYEGSQGIAFASELKPLLEIPWVDQKLDLQSMSHYLSLNYLPSPWTPFEGIRQLPPGHWLRVKAGKVEIKQYWDVPLDGPKDISENDACRTLQTLLHKSIERRLIADVPVGAFLSGGLDSSTLVALMKEHKHERIKTFSVGFNHRSYDEIPFAEKVAKYFGTEHYKIYCHPEDLIQNVPKIAWHADNLLADQAALPLYMVSKIAKEHVTVCLSGDGGDEVFIGYPTFDADRYHAIYSRFPGWLRRNWIERMVGALPASTEKMSFQYCAKKFIEAGNFSSAKAHYWWRTIFTPEEKQNLFWPETLNQIKQLDAFGIYHEYFKRAEGLPFVDQCLYADLKVWLAGNNLYKLDTMTMAHGLEGRVPFLDHEIVEYVARLPLEVKYRGRVRKYLLKKIMGRRIPEEILRRPKSGWHAPIGNWFRDSLSDYMKQYFSESRGAHLDAWLRFEQIKKMLRAHTQLRQNHTFQLWGLLILSHWFDVRGGKIEHVPGEKNRGCSSRL